MLTRKSPRGHSAKLLVALPLTLCCMMCFTQSSYSFKHDGKNIVTFRGNKFEFDKDLPAEVFVKPTPGAEQGHNTPDTVIMSSGSGSAPSNVSIVKPDVQTISVTAYGAPLKMNGKPIYTAQNGMQLASPTDKEKTLTDYLFYSVSNELSQLPDGEYTINIGYPIIDKKGNLVYYENKGVSIYNHMDKPMDKDMVKEVNAAITTALDNAPKLKPTIEDGKAVPSYDAWAFELGKTIVVSNHKVTMATHALKSM